MRRFLLFLMFAPLGLFAQSVNNDVVLPVHKPVNVKADNSTLAMPASRIEAKTQAASPSLFLLQPTDTFTMGVTIYDLQTNSSVARRILVYPDGEITAVWTTSPSMSDATFTLRGTGYNHYFASSKSWLLPAGQLAQPVEPTNIHSGWPNPCIDSSNSPVNEFCIGHAPGGVVPSIVNNTLVKVQNNKIGGNVWAQDPPISNTNTESPLWPRVAQSGKYAYMIAGYDSIANQQPTEIKGIKDPVIYYLSTNWGKTWTSEGTLPGYDTSANIGADDLYGDDDAYAIDAQDSTVAIVIGGYYHDVSLYKSTNYGQTFTKTIIDTFQNRVYHGGQIDTSLYRLHGKYYNIIQDSAWHYVNDGAVHVILDKKDNAHIFYGVRATKDSFLNPDYFTFNDFVAGIMHWDEKNHNKVIIGGIPNISNNPSIVAAVGTTFRYQANSTSGVVYEYGDDGLISMPSATIDSNGNVYCVYSVYMEAVDPGLDTTTDEVDITTNLHYRDLFISYSTDGGNTWASEQNITKTPRAEEVFPCLARHADSLLYLEYMVDSFAGNYVAGTTSSTRPPNSQQTQSYNNMKFMGIRISDVLNNNFGTPANYTGIFGTLQNNPLFSVSGIYPNPTEKGDVNVAITMNHSDEGSIQVYDIAGHLMVSQDLGMLNYGKQIENINTKELPAGMYFVKINAGGYTSVSKLVVE